MSGKVIEIIGECRLRLAKVDNGIALKIVWVLAVAPGSLTFSH